MADPGSQTSFNGGGSPATRVAVARAAGMVPVLATVSTGVATIWIGSRGGRRKGPAGRHRSS